MKTIKDLKQMISEPSSKEWFKKHGSPKHKALTKMSNADKAIKHHEILASKERKETGRDKMDKQFGSYEERFKKFIKK